MSHSRMGALCLFVVGIIAAVAVLVPPMFIPGTATAQPAPAGERVTITLTSDREYNSAATWYDADNRLRSQNDVPLSTQDQKTKLYSASLVYTARSGSALIDTLFQSSGRYAGCTVSVNEKRVVEQTAHGPHATVYCHR